jgi:hypothetical protein
MCKYILSFFVLGGEKVAIQKPYNINVRGMTISSSEDFLLTWKVSGDISVSLSVSIYKNSDGTLAWSLPKTSSYATQANIPAGSLTAGNDYKVQVQIWNQSGDTALSDYQIFSTSSRPVVTLDPISVASPSYNFTATYSQAENVSMQSWVAYLYNSDKVKIAQSPITTTTPIEYLFSNLQSNTVYYVEFQVTSAKTLVGTSGLISFTPIYSAPTVNATLTATNVDNAGISLSWSVVQVIGRTTGTTSFVNNEKIDVTNGSVIFDSNFSILSDFSLKLWLESPVHDVDLLVLKGDNGTITLQYWSTDNKFHLLKTINGYTTHVVSQSGVGIKYFVFIQQIGDNVNCFSNENTWSDFTSTWSQYQASTLDDMRIYI